MKLLKAEPMLVEEFDYKLPRELIAQAPLAERDKSRMMVLDRRTGRITHSLFKEFPLYLNKGDVLVLNSTKVIPAKAWGRKGKDEVDFLFVADREKGVWETLCCPARKVKIGDRITFAPGFQGIVTAIEPEGKRIIRFSTHDVPGELKRVGFAPLPPYIKRRKDQSGLRPLDLERYQTVYARREGAIAAPTAGLHFTPEILEEIRKKGVQLIKISLDVGLATFKPVRVERVEDHAMLEENYSISPAEAGTLETAKEESRPVVAVGTTVARALESASKGWRIRPGKRSTSLFIYPGYRFKVVDRLLTNFHLPKSTLIMMVSAFAGLDLIKKAYREAVQERYRFYNYGDCMLIL